MLISNAYAQAAGGAGQPDILMQILPLVAIFAIFYFLLIRPQQRKMKEHKAMVENLRRGDKVVTGGGIVGTVTKVNDNGEVVVEIAEGVKVTVISSTVSTVMSRTEPASGGGSSSKKGDEPEGTKAKGLKDLLGGKK